MGWKEDEDRAYEIAMKQFSDVRETERKCPECGETWMLPIGLTLNCPNCGKYCG